MRGKALSMAARNASRVYSGPGDSFLLARCWSPSGSCNVLAEGTEVLLVSRLAGGIWGLWISKWACRWAGYGSLHKGIYCGAPSLSRTSPAQPNEMTHLTSVLYTPYGCMYCVLCTVLCISIRSWRHVQPATTAMESASPARLGIIQAY